MYWDFDSREDKYAEFNHDAEIEDINDGLDIDQNIKEGGLSPIAHKNMLRDDVDDSSSEKKKNVNNSLGLQKAKAQTFVIDEV